jgi:hypothetical protein
MLIDKSRLWNWIKGRGSGLNGINPQNDHTYFVVIINGGKSPATNTNVRIFDWAEGDQKLTFPTNPCTNDCNLRGIEMLPNMPLGIRVPPVGSLREPPIWLVARIDYSDTQGKPHKTGICLVVNAVPPAEAREIRSCPAPGSNYAD